MKPLLIFQLRRTMADPDMKNTAESIVEGIHNGAIIVDSSVTILSFDEEGKLNYCTSPEV